jgi:hypothetical protein
MGLDFVSGQYGCLFSRCRKNVINSLIHWHFHIGLVIIPRPIYGGLGMITRPIWKCPCINLYLYQLSCINRYRDFPWHLNSWFWYLLMTSLVTYAFQSSCHLRCLTTPSKPTKIDIQRMKIKSVVVSYKKSNDNK